MEKLAGWARCSGRFLPPGLRPHTSRFAQGLFTPHLLGFLTPAASARSFRNLPSLGTQSLCNPEVTSALFRVVSNRFAENWSCLSCDGLSGDLAFSSRGLFQRKTVLSLSPLH